MNRSQFEDFEEWAEINSANELPVLVLPGGAVTITESAASLFRLMAPTKRVFVRGGAVVTLALRDDGLNELKILHPAAARSLFEKFARLFAWRKGGKNEDVLKPVNCPSETAEALLNTEEAFTILPRIRGLINCPVIREVGGRVSVAGPGYDEATGLMITGGEMPPEVPISEAVAKLLGLLEEFDFQTDGDRARAVASLITPALKAGGFLRGRAPADVAEADKSQSGKTYRQKIIAAIYNERVSLVTSRQGGVGSVDESLNQALVAGRPFIQFDNFRGKFMSAHLESFMTADGLFSCRVPHRSEVTVPVDHYFIFLTSNGVDTTRDFANRSNIIRIRKRPPGFAFRKYQEGDLLDHIRKHQPFYLGCVAAVLGHWQAQGKPVTEETRHDFREWVQMLDWITQNIFKTAPIMTGHQQAQERVSNPALIWLRSLIHAINTSGELNHALTATEITAICESSGIGIPGLPSGADEAKAKKVIGTVMAKLFQEQDTLECDGFVIVREEKYVAREHSGEGGGFKSKTYTVTKP